MAALFSMQNPRGPARQKLPAKRRPMLPPTTPQQPTVGINDYSSMRVNTPQSMDAANRLSTQQQTDNLSSLANTNSADEAVLLSQQLGMTSLTDLSAARMRANRINAIAQAQRLQRGAPGMQRSATSVRLPATAGVRNPFAMTGGRANSWSGF